MRTLNRTELFLLATGEELKFFIDGERLYKEFEELKSELKKEVKATKPNRIPKGKKLMRDPFVGYVLTDK